MSAVESPDEEVVVLDNGQLREDEGCEQAPGSDSLANLEEQIPSLDLDISALIVSMADLRVLLAFARRRRSQVVPARNASTVLDPSLTTKELLFWC